MAPSLSNGTIIRCIARGYLKFRDFQSEFRDPQPESRELGPWPAPTLDATVVRKGWKTTVIFRLEAEPGEEAEDEEQQDDTSSEPAPTDDDDDDEWGKVILVAEHNRVHRLLMSSVLASRAQPHVMVTNGQEAVDAYSEAPGLFRCILMSYCMPVVGGLEATKMIRALEDARGLRRVVIAAVVPQSSIPGRLPNIGPSAAAFFDFILQRPIVAPPRPIELAEALFGGPETNLIMQFGALTEDEKRAFPLRPRDPPFAEPMGSRARAVRDELKGMLDRDELQEIEFPIDARIRVVKRRRKDVSD